MTIAIVTDSAAALPDEFVARYDITVVPMRIENGERVSTSAPAPGDFEVAIRDCIDRGAEGVVVVTLTSTLSASCQAATVAARDVREQARVVDSRTAAGGQALVVLAAAAAADDCLSLAAVAAAAEAVAGRVRLVGTVPDLSHLVRSGRVPAVAGWAGRKLGVSPLFELRDGTVHRLRPARTPAAAVDRMISRVHRSREPTARLHVVALHAHAAQAAAALLARVESELAPATALVSEFGPVMVVHTGPGILGLAWWWETSGSGTKPRREGARLYAARMPDDADDSNAALDVPAERARRLADLDDLRERGADPYPVRFDRDRTLGELRAEFGDLAPGSETETTVRVAGRVLLIRRQGKLTFATMRDQDGSIQLFVSNAELGEDAHDEFDRLDLGDWVGVEGTVMTTRKGELSVKVRSYLLLAKALRPLPDKWHGLSDVDTRYRQRYVDLIVNEEARRVFEIRFAAVAAIREYFNELGFVEVETPVLHHELGGATARPFVTHHNALDLDLYLRIATELHLKRLVVGGFERVFEIGRVFRNEGIDTSHNPEFTMLEAYQAFADYHDMMELTETLVVNAARAALDGSTVIQVGGGAVDLAETWPRASMVALIREHADVDITPAMSVEDARAVLDKLGLTYQDSWGAGRLTQEVYEELVEPKLIRPTFVLDYPRETSPLARAHRDDPTLVERFEVVVNGNELANAYSELNDPIEQRERFEAEARARAAGDAEAGTVDEDYLRALEYGLPPTGGMGIGIDRLVMLLAGVTSIREVILFPTLRPEA